MQSQITSSLYLFRLLRQSAKNNLLPPPPPPGNCASSGNGFQPVSKEPSPSSSSSSDSLYSPESLLTSSRISDDVIDDDDVVDKGFVDEVGGHLLEWAVGCVGFDWDVVVMVTECLAVDERDGICGSARPVFVCV